MGIVMRALSASSRGLPGREAEYVSGYEDGPLPGGQVLERGEASSMLSRCS
jgi:hypothetical protein